MNEEINEEPTPPKLPPERETPDVERYKEAGYDHGSNYFKGCDLESLILWLISYLTIFVIGYFLGGIK